MLLAGAYGQEGADQVQQILECGEVCFLPGCADPALRHVLLHVLPEGSLPAEYSSTVPAGIYLENFLVDERVQSLCDIVVQSGRMLALNFCSLLMGGRCIRSLAAVPVERPLGILGLFLLADEEPGRFGKGEESLLSRYLARYAQDLEAALWERWCVFARDRGMRARECDVGCASRAPERVIKSELVSMVGHELRAPLSVIKGYAGLLQTYGGERQEGQQGRKLAPERQQQYLDAIMEQTGILEVLLNDFLDLARLQHGKLAMRPTAVDVGTLCQQISRLGQLRADQQEPGKHQLVCKVAACLPPVWTDGDRLRQVLMNLVENALKYSPLGGRIELEARLARFPGGQHDLEQVEITIRDRGIGISHRQFARLFQPFERLEQPATTHVSGFGLGLYIARQFVIAMGGRISLQSCEGCGTNVIILLPTVVSSMLCAAETVVQMPSSPL